MRLLKIHRVYPEYLKYLYNRKPNLFGSSYKTQRLAFDQDGFFWEGYWAKEFSKIGYEVQEVILNCEALQRAWCIENLGPARASGLSLEEITLEQARAFQPEIVWLHHWDVEFLRRLREQVPSIRLVVGWVGSSVPKLPFFAEVDLLLSCAPESVQKLQQERKGVAHINHWFVPEVTRKLATREKRYDFTFIGSLERGGQMHLSREDLFLQLMPEVDLAIFSSSYNVPLGCIARSGFKIANYTVKTILEKLGFSQKALRKIPLVGRACIYREKPRLPVNYKLKSSVRPGVFGLQMLQVLRDSRITFNVHATSSPWHASNLRLFEATGVGTCLLTDHKEHLKQLFEPDEEVVVYRNASECREKVKWLLAHPHARETIGKSGHERVMRDHTFAHRVPEMDYLFRKALAGR